MRLCPFSSAGILAHAVPALVVSALVLVIVPVFPAQAQLTPRIGYVYPAGGRPGATFQLTVGGQYLASASNACFSGAGIQAAVLDYTRPLTQKEFNDLRGKLKELQEKRSAAAKPPKKRARQAGAQQSAKASWTDADEKLLAEIRKKLANPPNRQGNPAIAEKVTLRVTLAPGLPPGERELRLQTARGLSNPLIFQIGQLPEFSKPPAKALPPRAATNTKFRRFIQAPPAPTEMSISLPVTVNGQIMPGAVDRFRFPGRKGQQLVIAVSARDLIPYLADAVPGWFQATLALYDARGHELAFDDDYRFHPDPVLHYELPHDGLYTIEVCDAIYRGREDFVYRITVGELPFITSIFPLGAPADKSSKIELTGWNLPVTTLTLDNPAKGPGICPVSVRKRDIISNHVPFAFDDLPECLEQEPNSDAASAQTVALPVIINGRIGQPGDWDVFRFEAQAGAQIVAEVVARRLDSPLDSVLKLTDASGRQLAFNDDHEDKGAGLTTHHADSRISVTLPATGPYYLHLGDTQHKGGPDYAYRLHLSLPRPDFALRVVPSSLTGRPGASIPLTVYALRKDGFSNEIALACKDAPRGCALSGGTIPAGQEQIRLTLTVPFLPNREPFNLALEGHALIQGNEITRPAVPAEDMMQAFAYRHLVPAKELKLAVAGRAANVPMKILGQLPVQIPAGGTARVEIAAPRGPFAAQIHLELNEPPEGIALRSVSPSRGGRELLLESDASKVKPGLKGNLIINAFAERPAAAPGKAKMSINKRPLATLPAIPFEIVSR